MSRTVKDDDEIEDSLADIELTNLQRQHRLAEGGRKAYSEGAQSTIRKQKLQLDKLKQDNEFLKAELATVESGFNQAQVADLQLRQLTAKSEGYKAEIESEKELQSEIDKQISSLERQIRNKTKSVSKGRESSQAALNRQIATVENRLEKTLRDFNTALTQNSKLRETIDHLKAERNIFTNLQKKVSSEVEDLKTEMANVVEASNQAHEQREEALNKTIAVKDKAEKEIQQYNMDIKELTRTLEHDRKLKSFMGTKSQDRGAKEMAVTRRREQAAKELKPEDLVKTYEETFSKIKTATGIEDTNKLVQRFIEVEDQNFALFNYVNELNNEIETLQEKIAELQHKQELAAADSSMTDQQRQAKMAALESKLIEVQGLAATFKTRRDTTQGELNTLKESIEQLFNDIGCDKAPILDKLGNSAISDNNVFQFLGGIETRTNELLYLKTLLDTAAHSEWRSKEAQLRDQHLEADASVKFNPEETLGPMPTVAGLLGVGPRHQTLGATNVLLQPPSTGDDLSDDEEAAPLSHNEMKAKIIGKMNKRGGSAESTRSQV